ncbi:hypothetical protein C7M84_019528 [Penaeus vannamei]|uniref:Uncharacterized protein n=1 Tax=Penaeus vannamei TaxID=6689 RepID=A0A3R7MIK6_PENVA|nr:hypothetical protein C7M84_019528 [Penaeus vannamei]
MPLPTKEREAALTTTSDARSRQRRTSPNQRRAIIMTSERWRPLGNLPHPRPTPTPTKAPHPGKPRAHSRRGRRRIAAHLARPATRARPARSLAETKDTGRHPRRRTACAPARRRTTPTTARGTAGGASRPVGPERPRRTSSLTQHGDPRGWFPGREGAVVLTRSSLRRSPPQPSARDHRAHPRSHAAAPPRLPAPPTTQARHGTTNQAHHEQRPRAPPPAAPALSRPPPPTSHAQEPNHEEAFAPPAAVTTSTLRTHLPSRDRTAACERVGLRGDTLTAGQNPRVSPHIHLTTGAPHPATGLPRSHRHRSPGRRPGARSRLSYPCPQPPSPTVPPRSPPWYAVHCPDAHAAQCTYSSCPHAARPRRATPTQSKTTHSHAHARHSHCFAILQHSVACASPSEASLLAIRR